METWQTLLLAIGPSATGIAVGLITARWTMRQSSRELAEAQRSILESTDRLRRMTNTLARLVENPGLRAFRDPEGNLGSMTGWIGEGPPPRNRD
ncbi:MAG: hypothetical protein M3Q71_02590 [Chloroflexota bacterium]|nr:hypothetical protein [Chloroflexota bacterium]